MIERAEHRYGVHEGVPAAYAVEHHSVASRRLVGIEGDPRPIPTSQALKTAENASWAYVNYGRWVAECPFCPSAQVVTPADPRWFCVECGNGQIGGAWGHVIFPPNVDDIERVLMLRPILETRNWLPHETAEELHAETELETARIAAELEEAGAATTRLPMRKGRRGWEHQ